MSPRISAAALYCALTRDFQTAAWKIMTRDAVICWISAFKLLNNLLKCKARPSAGTVYLKRTFKGRRS